MQVLGSIVRTATEMLDYSADFSAEIAANEAGDTIVSVSVTCADATMAVSKAAANAALTGVVWWMTGGATGTTEVEVVATTAAGRTMAVKIPVFTR
ncbi:MAG: hypothetical protein KGH75_00950 [Rhodospirillales bacterium]|nr:hypothetical protein [Rhodospirillales bacterium]